MTQTTPSRTAQGPTRTGATVSNSTETPAPEAPAQDATETNQQTVTWEELFKGEDPQKVRESLDNSRKWEKRAKDNKAAADRLAEVEQAQMSETEKADARIKAAEERAAELEAANNRKDLAIEHRLSADDAELLEGMTDVDAMRRVAERLARQAQEEAGPRAPKPNPAQRVGDPPAEDKDALARSFFGI